MGKRVGVLVVRSRHSLRRLVAGTLGRRNCIIRGTVSFQATVSGLTKCDCSYILLSVGLPSNYNVRVLRRVGGATGGLGIVVVSTHSSVSSGIQKLRLKTSSCLTGPFRVIRLVTQVHDITHEARGRNRLTCETKGIILRRTSHGLAISKGAIRLLGGRFSVLGCFLVHPNRAISGTILTRTI